MATSNSGNQLSGDLQAIERAAKAFADRHLALSECVTDIDRQLREIKRKNLRRVIAAATAAKDAKARLQELLEASKAEFIKPRSRTFHGVTVGFRKGKGGISWDDPDTVVKLIKRHFPEQAEILISTVEKPVKDALARLSGAELKKVGCTVEETGDVPFIKTSDSEIEKLVDALMKEPEQATA